MNQEVFALEVQFMCIG